MPHTELSHLLETAIVAARLAGQRAMEEMRYMRKSVKNNIELVTQADPICQNIIIDRIRESFPDHGFLAEEATEGILLRMPPRTADSIWWIIDPIDGTNNFANGLLGFCVSIAAMQDGKPIVGVIFDPATDSMYTAAEDMDAQLNGSRICVNEDEISKFASFAIDSHAHPATEAGVKKMIELTRFRCLGATALHMAYVAKGAMIGMVTGSARLWDIAAGAILVERAGGVIADLEGQSLFPLHPDDYQGESMPLLATSKKANDEIRGIFSQK